MRRARALLRTARIAPVQIGQRVRQRFAAPFSTTSSPEGSEKPSGSEEKPVETEKPAKPVHPPHPDGVRCRIPPSEFEASSPQLPFGFLNHERLHHYLRNVLLSRIVDSKPDETLEVLAPELGGKEDFREGVAVAYRTLLDLYNAGTFEPITGGAEAQSSDREKRDLAEKLLGSDLLAVFKRQGAQNKAQSLRDVVRVGEVKSLVLSTRIVHRDTVRAEVPDQFISWLARSRFLRNWFGVMYRRLRIGAGLQVKVLMNAEVLSSSGATGATSAGMSGFVSGSNGATPAGAAGAATMGAQAVSVWLPAVFTFYAPFGPKFTLHAFRQRFNSELAAMRDSDGDGSEKPVTRVRLYEALGVALQFYSSPEIVAQTMAESQWTIVNVNDVLLPSEAEKTLPTVPAIVHTVFNEAKAKHGIN